MQFFEDMDAVAKEELSVVQLSKQLLLNSDLVAREYQSLVPEAITYGAAENSDYTISRIDFTQTGVSFDIKHDDKTLLPVVHPSISMPQVYSLSAAIAVAHLIGVETSKITDGLAAVTAVNGRLQLLDGIRGSTIIDDTYNSSPEAAMAALQTLNRLAAPQKIALLGNMNELGEFSRQAHVDLGQQCDPAKIDELLTLGSDANEFLATAAEQRGCRVTRFTTPYQAGEYLQKITKPGALVLVKGSQNNVYAEEAVKQILASRKDVQKLVRQTPAWLKLKSESFS